MPPMIRPSNGADKVARGGVSWAGPVVQEKEIVLVYRGECGGTVDCRVVFDLLSCQDDRLPRALGELHESPDPRRRRLGECGIPVGVLSKPAGAPYAGERLSYGGKGQVAEVAPLSACNEPVVVDGEDFRSGEGAVVKSDFIRPTVEVSHAH